MLLDEARNRFSSTVWREHGLLTPQLSLTGTDFEFLDSKTVKEYISVILNHKLNSSHRKVIQVENLKSILNYSLF